MEHILGIDLGTTNSEAAFIKNGKVESILFENGEKLLPSCVAIDSEGTLLVGRTAKNQMVVNADSTILSIKRKMGQNCTVPLGGKEFSPEEISSFILKKIAQRAEEVIGEPVKKVVITVPAYFDDDQRKATKNAGTLAGLEVLRIINEPTAAAMAYESNHEGNKTILVYDLGGGTFDVSIVSVEGNIIEVKASHGDTFLGGDDFDNLLIEHIADQFEQETGIDLRSTIQSKNRLWKAAEKAKCELSDSPFAHIKEEFIWENNHLDMEISRSQFEEMITPLLEKTISCLHIAMNDASILPRDIDMIILAGGSTRVPLVAELLRKELRRDPEQSVNPDLIVSYGAAIQAGVISGQKSDAILVDITARTYGTSALGEENGHFVDDLFVPIIKKNTPLPVTKSEVFYTAHDNQKSVDVKIYEGDASLARNNNYIGEFEIQNLSHVPEGNEIILKLTLDLNGILEVTAEEKRTKLSKTVQMSTGSDRSELNIGDAMKNIASFMGENSEEIENSSHSLVEKAKGLRKRAEKIIETLDVTDADEVKALLKEIAHAISAHNMDSLEEICESLSDMLFYLED